MKIDIKVWSHLWVIYVIRILILQLEEPLYFMMKHHQKRKVWQKEEKEKVWLGKD